MIGKELQKREWQGVLKAESIKPGGLMLSATGVFDYTFILPRSLRL